MNENSIQRMIMLLVASKGITIFRNNVGQAIWPNGSRTSYGLHRGASDLIGWRPLLIRPADVGKTVAQFVAIECKAEKQKAKPHQQVFLNQVKKAGGLSGVAHNEQEALEIIEK